MLAFDPFVKFPVSPEVKLQPPRLVYVIEVVRPLCFFVIAAGAQCMSRLYIVVVAVQVVWLSVEVVSLLAGLNGASV